MGISVKYSAVIQQPQQLSIVPSIFSPFSLLTICHFHGVSQCFTNHIFPPLWQIDTILWLIIRFLDKEEERTRWDMRIAKRQNVKINAMIIRASKGKVSSSQGESQRTSASVWTPFLKIQEVRKMTVPGYGISAHSLIRFQQLFVQLET